MSKEFGDAARREINKDIEARVEELARGACKTFDDYKNLCGVIRGLRIAEDNIKALQERLNDDN